MVSRTKRGKAFQAFFDDIVEGVRHIPGVAGAVGNEWPGPEIVVFVDEIREELSEQISDAKSAVFQTHLDIDVEFHVRWLGGLRLEDYELAECDLVYSRDDGN